MTEHFKNSNKRQMKRCFSFPEAAAVNTTEPLQTPAVFKR